MFARSCAVVERNSEKKKKKGFCDGTDEKTNVASPNHIQNSLNFTFLPTLASINSVFVRTQCLFEPLVSAPFCLLLSRVVKKKKRKKL